MADRIDPYTSPAPDPGAKMRAAIRRRKRMNYVLSFGLFLLLFAAYWGIRILGVLLKHWQFPH